MERIFTRRDAERARELAELPALEREMAAERNRDMIAALLKLEPGIGILIRKGKPIYYRNFPVYREARNPANLVGEPA